MISNVLLIAVIPDHPRSWRTCWTLFQYPFLASWSPALRTEVQSVTGKAVWSFQCAFNWAICWIVFGANFCDGRRDDAQVFMRPFTFHLGAFLLSFGCSNVSCNPCCYVNVFESCSAWRWHSYHGHPRHECQHEGATGKEWSAVSYLFCFGCLFQSISICFSFCSFQPCCASNCKKQTCVLRPIWRSSTLWDFPHWTNEGYKPGGLGPQSTLKKLNEDFLFDLTQTVVASLYLVSFGNVVLFDIQGLKTIVNCTGSMHFDTVRNSLVKQFEWLVTLHQNCQVWFESSDSSDSSALKFVCMLQSHKRVSCVRRMQTFGEQHNISTEMLNVESLFLRS